MLRFNTAFLLKATAVSAFCGLPMALHKESGFVWTAFLFPASLAWLATTQVEKPGPLEVKFKELPNSVVEIYTTGGQQHQSFWKGRIFLAGACLSLVIGFPTLNTIDPEPIEFWLPLVVFFAVTAVILIGFSSRRRILTQERQFLAEYLLFRRVCWWRRRWQVREGDVLQLLVTGQAQGGGFSGLLFCHILFVCRMRRQMTLAFAMAGNNRAIPDMEIAAERIAELVDIPYGGYRKSR